MSCFLPTSRESFPGCLPLTPSAKATMTSLLFLKYAQPASTPGPLHLPFRLSQTPFPVILAAGRLPPPRSLTTPSNAGAPLLSLHFLFPRSLPGDLCLLQNCLRCHFLQDSLFRTPDISRVKKTFSFMLFLYPSHTLCMSYHFICSFCLHVLIPFISFLTTGYILFFVSISLVPRQSLVHHKQSPWVNRWMNES